MVTKDFSTTGNHMVPSAVVFSGFKVARSFAWLFIIKNVIPSWRAEGNAGTSVKLNLPSTQIQPTGALAVSAALCIWSRAGAQRRS